MTTPEEVLNTQCGLVVAPAGCGKTELIVQTASRCAEKPVLILTHTTAGVAALRTRLKQANVPSKHYRLSTIAGWAISMVTMFPERCGLIHDPLRRPDYLGIQTAVARLCHSGDVAKEITATYSRLLVDEYQDCSASQHQIVTGLAKAVPTVIFGDQMQAVFGFGDDPLADWDQEVCRVFPTIGELQTPWRWNRAAAEDLGQWLLVQRHSLIGRRQIDLRTCPSRVHWRQLGYDDNVNMASQVAAQYEIANPGETVLIIGDSRRVDSRHRYASRANGVAVVEPVDFRDVIAHAENIADKTGAVLLDVLLSFLGSVMTNVSGQQLKKRVQTILAGRQRNAPTLQEIAAIAVHNDGGLTEAVTFLNSMAADGNRRVYRRSAFNLICQAMLRAGTTHANLCEVAAQLREQRRHAGRSIPYRAVGSTLLLKGLESDHVLILDADNPGNPMTREHLYVAITRGAKSVHIFSRSPLLP